MLTERHWQDLMTLRIYALYDRNARIAAVLQTVIFISTAFSVVSAPYAIFDHWKNYYSGLYFYEKVQTHRRYTRNGICALQF